MEHHWFLIHQRKAQAAAQMRVSTVKSKKWQVTSKAKPRAQEELELPGVDTQSCIFRGHKGQQQDMVLCDRCNKCFHPECAAKEKGMRTMLGHSSVLHAKDRSSKKVSKTSWKTGHCMPTSGPTNSQKMSMNKSGPSNIRKSI